MKDEDNQLDPAGILFIDSPESYSVTQPVGVVANTVVTQYLTKLIDTFKFKALGQQDLLEDFQTTDIRFRALAIARFVTKDISNLGPYNDAYYMKIWSHSIWLSDRPLIKSPSVCLFSFISIFYTTSLLALPTYLFPPSHLPPLLPLPSSSFTPTF